MRRTRPGRAGTGPGVAPANSFSCGSKRPANPGLRMPVESTEVRSSPYLSQVPKERIRIVCLLFRSRGESCAAYLKIKKSCSRYSN